MLAYLDADRWVIDGRFVNRSDVQHVEAEPFEESSDHAGQLESGVIAANGHSIGAHTDNIRQVVSEVRCDEMGGSIARQRSDGGESRCRAFEAASPRIPITASICVLSGRPWPVGVLTGLSALVTGAGGGLGGAAATCLARDGASVVLMGRTIETLERAQTAVAAEAEAGAVVQCVAGDATTAADVQRAVAEASKLGR